MNLPMLAHDSNALCCPCGGEYLHQKSYQIQHRHMEYGDGLVVFFDGQPGYKTKGEYDLLVEPKPKDAPGWHSNRNALVVYFWCENCELTQALHIEQYKGQTFIHWKPVVARLRAPEDEATDPVF